MLQNDTRPKIYQKLFKIVLYWLLELVFSIALALYGKHYQRQKLCSFHIHYILETLNKSQVHMSRYTRFGPISAVRFSINISTRKLN